MARRSRPPRNRKSRTPDAPPLEVAVIVPPTASPAEELVSEAVRRGAAANETVRASIAPPPVDAELAELDAGWD